MHDGGTCVAGGGGILFKHFFDVHICFDICGPKSAHRKFILTLHCSLQTEFDLAGAYLAFC